MFSYFQIFHQQKNLFSGKTVLLKKKAGQTKEAIKSLGLSPNEEPLVYYVTLTSVDKFGFPEYPTGLFDQFTKKTMKKQDIIPITLFDLEKDFKKSNCNWDGTSDLFPRSCSMVQNEAKLNEMFEEECKRLLSGEINFGEFRKKMDENGINGDSALQEVMERFQNPTKTYTLDVYNLVYSFVKRNRKAHIFVDEMPILQSKRSNKLYSIPIIVNLRRNTCNF